MSETLQSPGQAPEGQEQLPPLSERLQMIDARFSNRLAVPTAHELGEALVAVSEIQQLNTDEYCDANGAHLDADLVGRVRQRTDPERFMFTADELDALARDVDADSSEEVSDKYLYEGFMAALPDQADPQAFGKYKQFIRDSLDLNNAIADALERADSLSGSLDAAGEQRMLGTELMAQNSAQEDVKPAEDLSPQAAPEVIASAPAAPLRTRRRATRPAGPPPTAASAEPTASEAAAPEGSAARNPRPQRTRTTARPRARQEVSHDEFADIIDLVDASPFNTHALRPNKVEQMDEKDIANIRANQDYIRAGLNPDGSRKSPDEAREAIKALRSKEEQPLSDVDALEGLLARDDATAEAAQPLRLPARLKHVFAHGKERLSDLYYGAGARKETAKIIAKNRILGEEDLKYRRRVLGAVTGAVALYTAYQAAKSGIGHEALDMLSDAADSAGQNLNAFVEGSDLPLPDFDALDGNADAAAPEAPDAPPEAPAEADASDGGEVILPAEPEPVIESLTHSGDTISHHAADLWNNGGYDQYYDSIDAFTDAILEYNGMSGDDARHMDIGQEFKIPPLPEAEIAAPAVEANAAPQAAEAAAPVRAETAAVPVEAVDNFAKLESANAPLIDVNLTGAEAIEEQAQHYAQSAEQWLDKNPEAAYAAIGGAVFNRIANGGHGDPEADTDDDSKSKKKKKKKDTRGKTVQSK